MVQDHVYFDQIEIALSLPNMAPPKSKHLFDDFRLMFVFRCLGYWEYSSVYLSFELGT